ncbi:ABC-2 family transporter protein [Clostridium saccharoperbutylacetonicum]|uniref:ABC-2 family transporter protein n=1 Tax=Clostridium saccharoperbutylacetonicum TaxID=36745 RepID=UPI0039ECDA5B
MISEAAGVFVVANVVTSVISGGIFPLNIFGEKIQAVFSLLPFQYTIYFPNLTKIPNYMRNGDLDMLIIKPVSAQFIVTLRYTDFGLAIPNIVGGVIMVAVGWSNIGITFNFINIVGFIAFSVIGILTTYPVLLFPFILSFWIVKTQAIQDITWALWDFNNMPMMIYGKWLQRIGIFVIPIFIITNFAPMFVMGMLSGKYILWAMIAPFLFIFLVRKFWDFAMKNYSSASS